MLSQILAQMNATLQPGDEPYTLDDAKQHVNDYNAWADGTDCERCQNIKALGGDFECADCFARSKGFRDAEDLKQFADIFTKGVQR